MWSRLAVSELRTLSITLHYIKADVCNFHSNNRFKSRFIKHKYDSINVILQQSKYGPLSLQQYTV